MIYRRDLNINMLFNLICCKPNHKLMPPIDSDATSFSTSYSEDVVLITFSYIKSRSIKTLLVDLLHSPLTNQAWRWLPFGQTKITISWKFLQYHHVLSNHLLLLMVAQTKLVSLCNIFMMVLDADASEPPSTNLHKILVMVFRGA